MFSHLAEVFQRVLGIVGHAWWQRLETRQSCLNMDGGNSSLDPKRNSCERRSKSFWGTPSTSWHEPNELSESGLASQTISLQRQTTEKKLNSEWLEVWQLFTSNIWGLSKIMVPENCPYAALSRTFRALSRPSRIGTWDYDRVFVYL